MITYNKKEIPEHLQKYFEPAELGLEPTFQEYISKLCDIFDEVKRVLKKTGTCWVNIGDTYSATRWSDSPATTGMSKKHCDIVVEKNTNLQDKCLCQIPSRFSIEMVDRGWILRNEIIWWKRNCMPSSVKDRFTVDFEKIFFFVKNKRYWFEQQFETVKEVSVSRLYRAVSNQNKWLNGADGQTKHTMNQPRPNRTTKIPAEIAESMGSPRARYKRYEKSNAPHEFEGSDNMVSPFDPEKGRNMRTVWDIPTQSFSGAHFAVFPEKLIEPMIRAGCPQNGTVLDPFSGSGTTLLVAQKLGRSGIGIDLNPEYVKMADKRLLPLLR